MHNHCVQLRCISAKRMLLLLLQQKQQLKKVQQLHHHHQNNHNSNHNHRRHISCSSHHYCVCCCRSCSPHRMQAHASRWAHPFGLRVVLLHVLLLGTLLPLPSHATLPPDRSAVSIVLLQHELRLHAHGGGDMSIKWALSADVTGERVRARACVYSNITRHSFE